MPMRNPLRQAAALSKAIIRATGESLVRAASPNRGRGGYGGSITHGGIVNHGTGLGTGLDKSEGSFFTPTRFWWRSPLELLYVQSSAARKFVDMPIEDMFIRWRAESRSRHKPCPMTSSSSK